MSAQTQDVTTTKPYVYPNDVLEFAAKQGKVADVPDRREADRLWFEHLHALMPKPSTIIAPILSLRRVKG